MTRAASRRLTAFVAAVIAAAFPASAWACADFRAAPSTRWSLATENGVSWLVTPCGERFFSLGVNVLDGGNSEHAKVGKAYSGYDWEAFAPTLQEWAAGTRRRPPRACQLRGSSSSDCANSSLRIFAVAPQMRCSPTM